MEGQRAELDADNNKTFSIVKEIALLILTRTREICHMLAQDLNPRLRLIQQAHMKGKVTLIRVDHNVVKKGEIKDPYRIEVSLKTIQAVLEKGGLPILLTHIGRP